MTDEPPIDAFNRYLKDVAHDLPERYRTPGRPRPHAPRRDHLLDVAIVAVIMIGALALWIVAARAEPCAIKGNVSRDGAKIYHLPGSASHAATVIDESKGERMFCSEEDALAAGWRPAKAREVPERSETMENPFR